MFGGVSELDTADQRACPFGFKRFLEGPHRVGVEVVAYEDHFLAVGVAALKQASQLLSPVDLGSALAHGHFTPPGQRFGEQENAGRPCPFIFIVHSLGMGLCGGNRRPGFLQKLDWLIQRLPHPACILPLVGGRTCFHAKYRNPRIVRCFIGLQHEFHVRHELGVGLGGNDTILDLALRHPVSLTRAAPFRN